MNAQTQSTTIDEVFALAIENNASLKASLLTVEEKEALINSAFSFDKTNIYYNYDESNLAINNEPLKVFGISQNFKFPTVYVAQKNLNKAEKNIAEAEYNIQLQKVKREVYSAYYQLSYANAKVKTINHLDSLYKDFTKASERRFELGETNYLEMISAKSKQRQIEMLLGQALREVTTALYQLQKVVQADLPSFSTSTPNRLELERTLSSPNAGFEYFESSKDYFNSTIKLESQNLLPDLSFEYFKGTNSSLNSSINGYQIGVKIPLLFSGNASKIKASKLAFKVAEEQQKNYALSYDAQFNILLAKLEQLDEALVYYKTQGKHLSEEIIKTAEGSFKHGEIDFFQFIQSIENAKDIELSYLDNLNQYNQTVIAINHLIL
jgi:cobalt-zinc-cadmium resistance protein CzcA